MQGILQQVKKTQTAVFFEVVQFYPKPKSAMEYFVLKISGQGLRYARKLLVGERICDFAQSNLLVADNDTVYVLPELDGLQFKNIMKS